VQKHCSAAWPASQVPVAFWEGRFWARISAQYYNTLADYQGLANAVHQLVSEMEANDEDKRGLTRSFRKALTNGHSANDGVFQ
jgi:hypothetical protein